MKKMFMALPLLLALAFSLNANGQNDDAAAAEGKTKVRIYWDSPDENERLKAEFEKSALAEEIELDFVEISGTVMERIDKLTIMMVGGEKIDLINISSDDMYDRFYTLGRLEPLGSYIESAGIDLSGQKSTMNKALRDGEYYGLPYRNTKWVTYLNKDIFEAAGVPLPEADWTWDDFEEIAGKLTSGSGTDKVYGAVLPPWPQSWSAIGVQAGADYYKDGEINIDAPEFVEALENLVRWQEKGIVQNIADMKTTKAHYAKGYFASGNYGMLIVGDWVVGQLNGLFTEKGFPFDYEIQVMPHPAGTEPSTWGSTNWAAMNSDSKNKVAAFKLLSWLHGEEYANAVARNGQLPATVTPEVIEHHSSIIPGFVENRDVFYNLTKVGLEKPAGSGSSIYINILSEVSDLVLMGGADPAEALAEAAERISAEIKAAE